MKPCETNIAQLTGKMISRPTYSHSVYEETFYCFSFGVPSLSGHVDILPVILPVSALKEVGLEETLELKGQLRSYNQAEGGANHLHIRFFVQELQPAGSSCACAQRQNYVFLEGFLCKPPVYRTTPFGREIRLYSRHRMGPECALCARTEGWPEDENRGAISKQGI